MRDKWGDPLQELQRGGSESLFVRDAPCLQSEGLDVHSASRGHSRAFCRHSGEILGPLKVPTLSKESVGVGFLNSKTGVLFILSNERVAKRLHKMRC